MQRRGNAVIGQYIKNKTYYVYVHTNMHNGKRYVGQTSQIPEKRWGINGHNYCRCTYFWNAIRKYGWDSFKHEILIEVDEPEHADSLERMLIKAWRTNDHNFGYNLDDGGNLNKHHSSETINKMKEKARNMSEEHRKKLSDAAKNRKLSNEAIQKMRKNKQGHKMSEETKRKISRSKKGCEFSEEHLENLRKAAKRRTQEMEFAVEAYTKDGVFKGRYSSATEAHLELGICISGICRCVRGERNTAGGYVWKPVSKENT